jgi:hypothetical protein
MISCPECLRTFSVALGGSDRPMREADCVYCGSLIHYAVVEPAKRAQLELLQGVRAGEMTQPASFSQLYD